ncbi:hypothetical protein [Sphingomonas sp. MS122]|uniref:hypothetical protein n=1 Tax=Sphingomonas sp. MS122 TaxID=3412683 RepID=UPI003C2CDA00
MDEPQQAESTAGAAAMFEWVTVTHLVIIALCAVGAIAIIVIGRRLLRRRIEAQRELEARNPDTDERR